ncbi:MAG TPA: hypothetical protein VNT79_16735 [Phycisphaerae bacterium]|nr:hypothetical protein [Phycisphaerae bacterium]
MQAPDESWAAIDAALSGGLRGLPGGDTISRLLARTVDHQPPWAKRKLSEGLILSWADEHHRRTKNWPTAFTGVVEGCASETWGALDRSLRRGQRGLRAGKSLALLLAERRKVFRQVRLNSESLTTREILAWGDEHHRRTGEWPRPNSGRIKSPPYVSWSAIDGALRERRVARVGTRSLQQLFKKHRDAPFIIPWRGTLRESEILEWADAYHSETGKWPNRRSGPVKQRPELTWHNIDASLIYGLHGLQKGNSFPKLLQKHRGVRNKLHPPTLTTEQILAWGRDFHRKSGRWPTATSGRIAPAPGETWSAVSSALTQGLRGFSGKGSLSGLLNTIRGDARKTREKRTLKVSEVILWIMAHRRRTGEWPDRYAGRILDARGETWFEIEQALQHGWRSLQKSSLKKLAAGMPTPEPLVEPRSRHQVRRRTG